MMAVGNALCGVVCGCVRVIVCLFLTARLFQIRRPRRKGLAAGVAGVAAIAAFLRLTGLAAVVPARIALEVLLIVFCASRLQGADVRMSLFVGAFFEIAVSFWQFLLAAGIGIVFRSPEFPDHGMWQGQAAAVLLHLLLVMFSLYLNSRQNIAEQDALRMASAAVLAGFIAVVTLSEQTVLAIPEDTLDQWTVLAVVLLMSVLVFRINRQYEAERELAKLRSEQAGLLERDYRALSDAYAVNAKLFHDFHNHVGALRQLLSGERYQEALQYLDALQAPVRNMADTVWTGDGTLDYLINSKAAAAEADGIDFQIQVEYPRHANIRSADLCAILGNLLDNALEAVRQVPEGEARFVRLTVRRIQRMLVIKVENACGAEPVRENGALKTTKTEGGLHGWGLKSAQTAADRYDGMVQTTCADGVFRAVATLSYDGILLK